MPVNSVSSCLHTTTRSSHRNVLTINASRQLTTSTFVLVRESSTSLIDGESGGIVCCFLAIQSTRRRRHKEPRSLLSNQRPGPYLLISCHDLIFAQWKHRVSTAFLNNRNQNIPRVSSLTFFCRTAVFPYHFNNPIIIVLTDTSSPRWVVE